MGSFFEVGGGFVWGAGCFWLRFLYVFRVLEKILHMGLGYGMVMKEGCGDQAPLLMSNEISAKDVSFAW